MVGVALAPIAHKLGLVPLPDPDCHLPYPSAAELDWIADDSIDALSYYSSISNLHNQMPRANAIITDLRDPSVFEVNPDQVRHYLDDVFGMDEGDPAGDRTVRVILDEKDP